MCTDSGKGDRGMVKTWEERGIEDGRERKRERKRTQTERK
jgi:hypothetical protein